MGARGQTPKLNKIKELEGNRGNRPLQGDGDGVVATGDPVRPDYLDDDAFACSVWDRLILSMPPGVYTAADSDLMVAYCLASSLMREASIDIQENGLTIIKDGLPTKNHTVLIMKEAAGLLATIGTRLGLNPAARQALQLTAEKPVGGKFAGLVNVGGKPN